MEQGGEKTDVTRYLRVAFATLISSGVLINAFYIYGLGFYQGYLTEFGFDYALFPVEWDETVFWVYYASRTLGVSVFNILVGEGFGGYLGLTFVLTYMIFMFFTWEPTPVDPDTKDMRLKKLNQLFSHKVLLPFRLLFTNEKSLKAILVSYAATVFMLFLPILLLLWSFFPLIGVKHGEHFVGNYIDNLEDDFCSNYETRYSPCVVIPNNEGQRIEGMIFAREGDLVGMHTENGAVMFTLPKSYTISKQ